MRYLLLLLLGFTLSAPALGEEVQNSPNTPAVTTHNEQNIDISGNEDQVKPQVRYLFYNFGRVRLFDTETATFTLRNRGNYPIYINDIDVSGNNFRGSENCPSLLWPGQRCRIWVSFRPNYIATFNGRVDIWLTGAEDVIIYLRGRGVWGF